MSFELNKMRPETACGASRTERLRGAESGNGNHYAEKPDADGELITRWRKSYSVDKEREFIRTLERCIPHRCATLLDIGCGIGLHTRLWSEHNKQVTASDFSHDFRDYFIRTYPFPFIWTDVLKSTITEQFDICFCMAIATILHGQQERFRTFETLAGLVRPEGYLVLVTPSNQRLFGGRRRRDGFLHSLDDSDILKLTALGMSVERVFHWSNTPKFLWRNSITKALARRTEAMASWIGLGARKVAILRKASPIQSKTRAAANPRFLL